MGIRELLKRQVLLQCVGHQTAVSRANVVGDNEKPFFFFLQAQGKRLFWNMLLKALQIKAPSPKKDTWRAQQHQVQE